MKLIITLIILLFPFVVFAQSTRIVLNESTQERDKELQSVIVNLAKARIERSTLVQILRAKGFTLQEISTAITNLKTLGTVKEE